MDTQPDQTSAPTLIWDMYKSLTEQCAHFNSLESTYRSLTSTWLLATFGGIGFVLQEQASLKLYVPYLIAAIAFAGAAGVLLLWLLDLGVYHKLLSSAFSEQLRLEKQNPWLPQVAHKMMETQKGIGVVPRVVWFYIGTYSALAGIGSVAIVHAVFGAPTVWLMLLLTLVAIGITVVPVVYKMRAEAAPSEATR